MKQKISFEFLAYSVKQTRFAQIRRQIMCAKSHNCAVRSLENVGWKRRYMIANMLSKLWILN